jgi:N-acetylmuramoyl-L-alanine amidase
LLVRRIQALVVHCAATKPSQDIGRKEIDRWHRDRGFAEIGYHYIIRRSGEVEKGRPDEKPGAHVAGHNHNTLGICLIGGLNEAGRPAPDYTQAQWAALRKLVQELLLAHPGAEVKGHRDFPGVNKACPSFDVAGWLDSP